MSEEFNEAEIEIQGEQSHGEHLGRPEPTGNAAVDAVLATLDSLDQTPVAEQVPVFESAHERFRAALADAGNEPSAP